MDAYIKKDRRKEFMEKFYDLGYGQGVYTSKVTFGKEIRSKDYIYKIVDYVGRYPITLIINKRFRLVLMTPNGETPFIECFKDKYQELIDLDMIEYRKNKFD